MPDIIQRTVYRITRMKYTPEINYNADLKIWSGKEPPAYFSKDLSIGEIIFQEMQRHPKLIAQISDSENTILTREELFLNSKRVASYLRNMKLQQSDIVGIIAGNITHTSAVAYGCFFNGIVIHPLNTSHDQQTIEKLYNITKPKIVFCDGENFEKVKAATEKLNVKIVTLRNHKEGSITIEEVLSTPIEENYQPARLEQGNNQTLAILCSSGTTGTPKAVTIPNDQILVKLDSFLTTADVVYVHSTLDWFGGFSATISSGVRSTCRIISDKAFDSTYMLQLVKKYKVTYLKLLVTYMAQMISCPEFKEDYLDSLRYFYYCGDKCSIEIQQSFRRRLPAKCGFYFIYGFTELSSAGTLNYHFDQKPNSVGRLMDSTKMKIINELEESLGPNEVGEICMHNGKYWAGYYGNPEESLKIRDNKLWYYSGDLGYVDEDGFLFIVDRKKNLLRYDGYQYYPQEIEKVISKMPEVSEVCVFGIWNPLKGDEAAAAVVKKLGENLEPQDVIDFVAKHLKAKYLQLHGGVFIVDDLKRNANGKTNRRITKEFCLQKTSKNES